MKDQTVTTIAYHFYAYLGNDGPVLTHTNKQLRLYSEKPSEANKKSAEFNAGSRKLKIFKVLLVPVSEEYPDEPEHKP